MSSKRDDVRGATIRKSLEGKFWAIAKKYDSLGALDSEAIRTYDWIRKRANEVSPVNWEKVEWELYDNPPGREEAEKELTAAAQEDYKNLILEKVQGLIGGLHGEDSK